MALFTDGELATLERLREYESAIEEVLTGERIEMSSKLRLAHEDVATDLNVFLAHAADEGGDTWALENVVVTTALRQWEVLHALELIYRDAYSSHLNDRYRAKWNEYRRSAREARRRLFEQGLGVTRKPIPKAPIPKLGDVAGTNPGGTFWARVSWVREEEEGAPSDAKAWPTAANTTLTVEAVQPPAGITGWNLYVGVLPDDVELQNDRPLAPGSIWTMPETGPRRGRPPGTGQTASEFLRVRHILLRG
jgi:hypothetical protein